MCVTSKLIQSTELHNSVCVHHGPHLSAHIVMAEKRWVCAMTQIIDHPTRNDCVSIQISIYAFVFNTCFILHSGLFWLVCV